jgi:predicted chitinase
MADNNLGSNQEIDDLSQNFESFSSQLSSDDKGLSIAELAQKKSIESLKKQKEAQKAALAASNAAVKGLLNFGKSLSSATSGKDGFDSLNKVIGTASKLIAGAARMIPIPFVGEAVAGVVEGAAEVSKFLVGQFSKAYGNFEKLADTGVISTFDELKQSAATIGLTFSDTEKVLSKYSTELAVFGGTASKGRERLQNIAFETKKAGQAFQKIGISASDFVDIQTNYITRQQRLSFGKKETDKELANGSLEWVEKLDTLSKLTGVSRKELQEQMNDRTRTARYLAGIAPLDVEIRKKIDLMLPKFAVLGPEFADGIMEAIASEGTGDSEKETNALFAVRAGGMDVVKVLKELRETGNTTKFEAEVKKALINYRKEYYPLIKYLKQDNIVSASFNAAMNVGAQSEKEILKQQEEIAAKRKKNLEETGTEDDDLAATRRLMYNSTKNVELLATGSKTMTGIMNNMASGIEYIVGKLYEAVGDDGALPEYIKYRKEERQAIEENVKTQKNLNDDLNRQAALEKEQDEIDKNPNNPRNKALRLKNERALETLKLQIKLNRILLEEQEEKIKIATAKKKKADQEAGLGPPTPAKVPAGSPSLNTSGGSQGGTAATQAAGGMPAGSAPTTVGQNQQLLLQAMNDLKVMDPQTRAAMAAVAEGESAFQMQSEFSYSTTSAKRIRNTFAGVQGMSDDEIDALKKDDVKFWDQVYGYKTQMGRDYGNTQPGDGMKYRGRGFIGITFKTNYEKYGKLLGIDLVGNPDLANDPKIAARIGVMMMLDGMKNNKQYQNSDMYTKVARSIGNPNEVTEQRKKDAYARNLENGQFGTDKLADLGFITSSNLPGIPSNRTGGILSGPSTGYLAILHGDEMVIPANPGSSVLQFEGTTEDHQSDDMIQGILLMMTKKIDKMIDVTRNEISTQNRIAISGVK